MRIVLLIFWIFSFPFIYTKESDIFCDYENYWHVINTDNGLWQYVNKSDGIYGPEAGKCAKYFKFISKMPSSNGILLYNNTNGLSSTKICLSFWYYMYGSSVGDLIISDYTNIIWKIKGNQGNKWLEFRQTLNNINDNITVKIMIESIVYEQEGSICIDSLQVINDECIVNHKNDNVSYKCDFENDLCENMKITLPWQIAEGTSKEENRPKEDHTRKSIAGHYLYAPKNTTTTVIINITENSANDKCMSFWFKSHSAEEIFNTRLNVYSESVLLWSFNYITRNWKKAFINLKSSNKDFYNIIIRIERVDFFNDNNDKNNHKLYNGYYAIDDIEIDNKLCPDSVNCTFRDDFCGWTYEYEENKKNWLRIDVKDNKSKFFTEELKDNYLLAYTKGENKAFDSFISGDINMFKDHCFKFNYYCQNTKQSQLNIKTVYNNRSKIEDIFTIKIGKNNCGKLIEKSFDLKALSLNTLYSVNITDVKRLTNILTREYYQSLQIDLELSIINTKYGGIALNNLQLVEGLCDKNTTATTLTSTFVTSENPLIDTDKKKIDCDFEVDICNWKIMNNTNNEWKIMSRKDFKYDSDIDILPLVDHTYETVSGHFLALIYLEEKHSIINNEYLKYSTIVSKEINSYSCLQFWYLITDSSLSSKNANLTIALDFMNDTIISIWERTEKTYSQWIQANIQLPNDKYVLRIIGNKANKSFIAIDDILLTEGKCNTDLCTFETDECLFTSYVYNGYNQKENINVWKLINGNDKVFNDHTTKKLYGKFMYLDEMELKYANISRNSVVVLSSAVFDQKMDYNCIEFAYIYYSNISLESNLSIYINEVNVNDDYTNIKTLLWNLKFTKNKNWRTIKLAYELKYSMKFQILFEYKVNEFSNNNNIIAIDDFRIQSKCSSILSCDFEVDFCNWYQDAHNDDAIINWDRSNHASNVLLSDTMLLTADGNYAYIEYEPALYKINKTNKNTIIGNKLESLILSDEMLNNDICFRFSFYINGPVQWIDLNLYDNNNTKLSTLWKFLYSMEENIWKQKILDLHISHVNSKLVWDVKFNHDNTKKQLVAIDNIKFNLGLCPTAKWNCNNGLTITREKLCDFINDCGDGSDEKFCGNCDFDNDLCQWNNDIHLINKWQIVTFESGDIYNDVPRTDTFFQTHKDTYIVAYSKNLDIPLLLSPLIQKSSSFCTLSISFYARHIDFLDLYLSHAYTSKTVKIFSFPNITLSWKTINIDIGRNVHEFRLKLVGKYKKNIFEKKPILAIDFIKWNDDCGIRVNNDKELICSEDKFLCKTTKQCIAKNRLCDLTDDCGDYSDEDTNLCTYYERCNFNNDLCNWSTNWRLSNHLIPDHTTNSMYGSYLMLKLDEERLAKAFIRSPDMRLKYENSCIFRFYYRYYEKYIINKYLDGTVYATVPLRIVLNKNKEKLILKVIDTIDTLSYKLEEIHLNTSILSINSLFYLTIESDSQFSNNNLSLNNLWIIDDVSFTSGCSVYNEYKCESSEHVIDTSERCDFRKDCPDGDDEVNCTSEICTFEESTCGWQSSSSEESWLRIKVSNLKEKYPSDNELPEKGKTYDSPNEWILFAYYYNNKTIETYEFISSIIERTAESCFLSFDYYTHYTNIFSSLELVYIDVLNKYVVKLWELKEDSFKWHRAYVSLRNKKHFRLKFIASGKIIKLALDNINFNNCIVAKQLDLHQSACNVNEFKCSNNVCIDINKVCDSLNDCMDNSDENICTKESICDFNDDCIFWRYNNIYGFHLITEENMNEDHSIKSKVDTDYHQNYLIFSLINNDYYNDDEYASLTSKLIVLNKDECNLKFWYNIIGYNNQLFIKIVYNNNIKLLVNIDENVDFWFYKKITINKKLVENNKFYIVIEGKISNNKKNYGSISIDNIALDDGCLINEDNDKFICDNEYFKCNNSNFCYHKSERCNFIYNCPDKSDEDNCGYECDFEESFDPFCKWKSIGLIKWQTMSRDNNNYTLIRSYGDHSGENKSYLIAIKNSFNSKTAILSSPLWYNLNVQCKMEFYYSFNSTVTNSLNILLKEEASNRLSVIKTIVEKYSNDWMKESVNINENILPFRIYFSIDFIRDNIGSNVAIDDIKLVNCIDSIDKCEWKCPNEDKCISLSMICNGIYDCKDKSDETIECPYSKGNCDFNKNDNIYDCGWYNLKYDFDWTLSKGSISNITGIQFKHTTADNKEYNSNIYQITENDHYLLMRSNHTPGAVATLLGPKFSSTEYYCHMTYSYYMYGEGDVGPLKIAIKDLVNNNIKDIHQEYGNLGQVWFTKRLHLKSSTPFRVIIKGRVNERNKSDIAIGFIRFSPNCINGNELTLDDFPNHKIITSNTTPMEPKYTTITNTGVKEETTPLTSTSATSTSATSTSATSKSTSKSTTTTTTTATEETIQESNTKINKMKWTLIIAAVLFKLVLIIYLIRFRKKLITNNERIHATFTNPLYDLSLRPFNDNTSAANRIAASIQD